MTKEEKRRDQVLQRMLRTPPTPHSAKPKKRGGSQGKKKAEPKK